MSKLVLGLDIGITSVGWGIIDQDSGEIIDAGVRIFNEGTAELNQERRGFRGSRRLIRRRKHRLTLIKGLLKQHNIIDDSFKPLDNPYEIRARGLTNRLSNEELATAILHIAKRRGLYGVDIVEDDEEKAKDKHLTKRILSENNVLLKNKYICEVQLERLNKEGKVRGECNRFNTSDYIKELQKIFSNQPQIDEKLKEKLIEIIERRRQYYEGPGSQDSPTPYGRFTEKGQLEPISLIDKMRGNCTIYPNEKRAPKMSYTADLFNFLNDLNNLSVNGEPISKDMKEKIIEEYINEKGNITPKQLAKIFNVEVAEIQGFRINKKREPILTKFEGYKKIKDTVEDNNLNPIIYEDKDYVDNIIEILTTHKGIEERRNLIQAINPDIFDEKTASILASIDGISGYHSLSRKVIKEVIEDLLETNYNQMQIFQMNGYFGFNKNDYRGKANIPFNNELILSPVARRSQQEAIKIINAIRKRYGELDSIVIEMARDANSKKEKERLKAEQALGEKINEEIKELLKGKKVSGSTRQKIRLYKEQNGKCLYTGKEIDLNTLINDPHQYEIDHIIPLSISFDDSMQNKVLVYEYANRIKGQRTPYQYFKLGQSGNWTFEDFKRYVLSLDISQKKKNLLLYLKDINSYEVKKEFINRNLVDTRYASRGILNTLTDYFKANEVPTKVYTIRGAITSAFRKKIEMAKNRDEDYKHHAIDALIVAGIKKMKFMDAVLNFGLPTNVAIDKNYLFNTETGEVLAPIDEKEFFDEKYLKFINNLHNIDVRYSHKIDSKPNRSISDQTIYGVRNFDGEEYVIKKYKNIYDSEGENLAKLFKEGKASEKLLMYKHNPKTYYLLEQIVKQYPNEKNPFLKFKEENGDYIRKYSKKGKGPIVKSVRYIDGKLGSHLDISHNYQKGNDSKVVLLQLNPYRVDIYQEKEGSYKFLKINYHYLKNENGKYFIDDSKYQKEKEARKISKDAELKFSLYKNDLFYFETIDGERDIVRFNGATNSGNRIEYKKVNNKTDERLILGVGRKTKKIEKITADVLGINPKKILAKKERVMV
jgi:CRISPR-associated endonuclease Csn1